MRNSFYMEKNKGGYYDTNTVREYHYDKSQDMKDIFEYNGETGFANTIDVSYMGDFASQTFNFEYVDYNDNYKVKTTKGWFGYFRGDKIDVTPNRFQTYKDFYYADGYLFASTGKEIDVYEGFLGYDLVLQVVDAENAIKKIKQ